MTPNKRHATKTTLEILAHGKYLNAYATSGTTYVPYLPIWKDSIRLSLRGRIAQNGTHYRTVGRYVRYAVTYIDKYLMIKLC